MKIASIDFETYYDPSSGYSLTNMNMSEYILDPRFRALGCAFYLPDKNKTIWVPEERLAKTIEHLRPQLEGCTMLAQNTPFDAAILAWHYGIECAGYLDTLSMARARGLRQEIGSKRLSLKAMCQHFNIGEKPDLRPDSTPEELLTRGTWDAWATWKLFEILAQGYPKSELRLIDLTIKQYIRRTVYADTETLVVFIAETHERRRRLLASVGYTEEDMQSGGKFVDALAKLGIQPPMKISKTTGLPTLALAKTDEAFKDLLDHEDDEIRALAECRVDVKSTGDITRAETFMRLAAYGALPVLYKYSGAHTHRWAGDDGTNFTNLKRGGRLRDAIVAPDGYVFVAGDLSQIECRITAELFGETQLTEAFRQGRDVYSEFATVTFNRYDNPVTKKDIFERFSGKTTVLGAGFQCGKKKLWRQMRADIWKYNIPITPPTQEVADACIDHYRGTYTRIVQGWGRAEGLLFNPGASLGPVVSEGDRLLLPSGLRIYYHNLQFERWEVVNDDGEKEIKSGYRYDGVKGRSSAYGGSVTENMAQALARIKMSDAMLELSKRWRVVMHTYDEIVLCVPENQAGDAAKDMRATLTKSPDWMPNLPLACEIGTDYSYGGCK